MAKQVTVYLRPPTTKPRCADWPSTPYDSIWHWHNQLRSYQLQPSYEIDVPDQIPDFLSFSTEYTPERSLRWRVCIEESYGRGTTLQSAFTQAWDQLRNREEMPDGL